MALNSEGLCALYFSTLCNSVYFSVALFFFSTGLVCESLLKEEEANKTGMADVSGFSIATLNVHGWTDAKHCDNTDRVVALVKVTLS